MSARDDFPAMAKVLNARIKWTDESIAAEMDRALDKIDKLQALERTAYKAGYVEGYDQGYQEGANEPYERESEF